MHTTRTPAQPPLGGVAAHERVGWLLERDTGCHGCDFHIGLSPMTRATASTTDTERVEPLDWNETTSTLKHHAYVTPPMQRRGASAKKVIGLKGLARALRRASLRAAVVSRHGDPARRRL